MSSLAAASTCAVLATNECTCASISLSVCSACPWLTVRCNSTAVGSAAWTGDIARDEPVAPGDIARDEPVAPSGIADTTRRQRCVPPLSFECGAGERWCDIQRSTSDIENVASSPPCDAARGAVGRRGGGYGGSGAAIWASWRVT